MNTQSGTTSLTNTLNSIRYSKPTQACFSIPVPALVMDKKAPIACTILIYDKFYDMRPDVAYSCFCSFNRINLKTLIPNFQHVHTYHGVHLAWPYSHFSFWRTSMKLWYMYHLTYYYRPTSSPQLASVSNYLKKKLNFFCSLCVKFYERVYFD